MSKEYQGVFLRKEDASQKVRRPTENAVDDELVKIGVRYRYMTGGEPQGTTPQQKQGHTEGGRRRRRGNPTLAGLFLALTVGILVCEAMGLMAEVIADPGACICAACFGWNARR